MKKLIFIIAVFSLTFLQAQQEYNYTIKNLKANSKNSDFGVTFYSDNTVVFASSRKNKNFSRRIWLNNKQPYLELFVSSIDSTGEFGKIKLFSDKINTKFHESNIVFTKDLSTVYFSRNNYINNKIKKDENDMILIQLFKATVGSDGKWTNITSLPFNSDNYQTGHPALNEAENKLYFVSDMPGSIGKTDIYVVDILPDGSFGDPTNLGPNVNTINKEMFPYITKDNVLYFSSEGFNTDGGLDIFATKIIKDEAAYKPVNLGFPINSKKDDFAFVFKPNDNTGYFSSNREGGQGDDDIYFFQEHNPVFFACEQEISGTVREEKTNALLPGALVELKAKDGKVIKSVIADSFARFKFVLDCNSRYTITGSKINYASDTKTVVTEEETDLTLSLSLILKPNKEFTRNIFGQLVIDLNPIYFDLDKSYIRSDAAIELEKVIRIMNKYPELKIDLGSHTDSRASFKYNESLSQRRAISTRNWIIKRGIDKSRLTAKGYGENKLVNDCSDGVKCTEAEHQLNRRTEFVIINPEVLKN